MKYRSSVLSLCTMLAAALAGASCAEQTGDRVVVDSASCPTGLATCIEVAKAPLQADTCSQDRWVAVRSAAAAACPAVRGGRDGIWRERPLFGAGEAERAGGLPLGLQRYCLYEWEASTPAAAPDVAALATLADVSGLAPDCLVTPPMGLYEGSAAREALRSAFRRQAGALDRLPASPGEPPAAIRVAVVDSSPDGYDGGRPLGSVSDHGFIVGSIVRELGCPQAAEHDGHHSHRGEQALHGVSADSHGDRSTATSGPCIAHVSHHLALGHGVGGDAGAPRGGIRGTQAELATAIARAVEAWRVHRAEQPHLVLNLSLGWEPRYGGHFEASPDELPAPTRAVYAALMHASCLDAVVIAAAGNDPGGPELRQGAVYPAAWETRRAPDASACAAFEGPGFDEAALRQSKAEDGYRPLVYSVGGLASDDQPLAIGRRGGRPRLAAPGAHAVAGAGAGDGALTSAPLSGTSVSAAVVSGVAATVWGYRPSLTGAEVMELVYRSGVGLGDLADYGLGDPPGESEDGAAHEIRRVGLCGALELACAEASEACPPREVWGRCEARPAFANIGEQLSTLRSAGAQLAAGPVVSAADVAYELPPLPVCGDTALFNADPVYPEHPCPARQYYGEGAGPWVVGQPSSNPCPACRIRWVPGMASVVDSTYNGTLYIEIDASYPGRLLSPTLFLPRIGYIALPDMGILTAGSVRTITDIHIDQQPTSGAKLSFAVLDTVGNVTSSVESLLREQQ